MADKLYEKLTKCVDAVRSKTDFVPSISENRIRKVFKYQLFDFPAV